MSPHWVAAAGGIAEWILGLRGWGALAIVFALPALEASAFVGVVVPGEIAVLIGGVLAFEGRVGLGSVIAAAVLGAVLGDTVGYFVGRRWGARLLGGSLARRVIRQEHLDRARHYLRRRGGRAVLVGRFTAALRAFIPGLAGMSDLPYRTFIVFNALGGLVWGTGFVFVGFLAGAGWRRAERIASTLGLGILGLIVVVWAVSRVARRGPAVRRLAGRLVSGWPLAPLARRFPSQAAWVRRRLVPGPTGLALTVKALVGIGGLWMFGGLTQDVLAGEELALWDPRVEAFVRDHVLGWVDYPASVIRALGSVGAIAAVLVVAGVWLVLRRGNVLPAAAAALGWLVVVVLGEVGALVVSRSPGGLGFPAVDVARTAAVWGIVAVGADRGSKESLRVWIFGAVLVLLVAVADLATNTFRLTGVLAGLALGSGVAGGALALLAMAPVERWRLRPLQQ